MGTTSGLAVLLGVVACMAGIGVSGLAGNLIRGFRIGVRGVCGEDLDGAATRLKFDADFFTPFAV